MKKALNYLFSFLLLVNPVYSQEFVDPFDSTKTIRVEKIDRDKGIIGSKRKLREKGVPDSVINRIPNDFLEEYANLSSRYKKDVLERSVELHDIFKDELRPFEIHRYVDIVKESTSEHIESLRRLKKLVPDRFQIELIGDYFRLLRKNVPFEVTIDLSEDNLILWSRYFNDQRTDELIKLISKDPVARSRSYAEHIEGFSNGTDHLRNHLKKRIRDRSHFGSKFPYNNENAEQLDVIKDKYILALIKGYDDLFSQESALEEIRKLFRDKNPKIKFEKIAIIGSNDYRFTINPLRIDEDNIDPMIYSETFCTLHPIIFYIEKVGVLHTHRLGVGAKRQIYATPSGRLSPPFTGGDSYVLSQGQRKNPLQIDCIVSELPDKEFDVDLLLRNTRNINGKVENHGDFIVIDLGIYK